MQELSKWVVPVLIYIAIIATVALGIIALAPAEPQTFNSNILEHK